MSHDSNAIPVSIQEKGDRSSDYPGMNDRYMLESSKWNKVVGDSESYMEDDVDADEGFSRGRWTQEEHERFLQALHFYGRDWSKVQNFVKTRSSTQA